MSDQAELLAQSFYDGAYHFSGDPDIDATLIGSRWTSVSLTYSFPTSGSFYGSPYRDGEADAGKFEAFNAAQEASARDALAQVAALTNLQLSGVTESLTVHATFRFAQTSEAGVQSAYANFPTNEYYAGDVWFGQTGQPFYLTPAKGNWGAATIMHELGHALGLKHGHSDYTLEDLASDLGVPSPRYGTQALPAAHDGQAWSLMTISSKLLSPASTGDSLMRL